MTVRTLLAVNLVNVVNMGRKYQKNGPRESTV